ncbi:MAG: ketoacyl-ACP synthase III [Planctomycetaceae bacterium]|jgi:3-oxoacyl-[acyl-carrier-protein] synthase-3|nr:ketoacyl-ACP synthase III [Planctomycetaceae bacterium]
MSVQAQIQSIAYYLPEKALDNAELVQCFHHWTAEKVTRKLGINRRPIAAGGETAADMAVKAAERLLSNGICDHTDIDFLLFCTQSPDYFLPTSACIVHDKLGLPKSCGALDFNLGCSGYVYGLSLAKGLIETGTAKNVLLITSETYSKYINPLDRASRPLFGDAAAATLVNVAGCNTSEAQAPIGPFVFGTDGSGADMLIVPAGGHRLPKSAETALERADGAGSIRSLDQLKMHGAGVFSFAINRVPPMVEELLQKSGKNRSDVGCYIFHQANKYMLDRLQELCRLENTNFFNDIKDRGNTVSSSIPIAMCDAWQTGMLKPNVWTMLIGFGVGLSWGGTLVKVPEGFCVSTA